MKQFLEFLPLLAFLLGYVVRKDIYAATAAFLVTSVVTMIVQRVLKINISKAQWITLALGLVLGGATLLFHNDLFIKVKPTVIYWLFAVVLFVSAQWFDKNLMEAMLGKHAQAPATVWQRSNQVWVAFFTVMGILNLWLAFRFELQVWVYFKTIGAMAMTLAVTLWQVFALSRYMNDADGNKDQGNDPTNASQPANQKEKTHV